MRATIPSPKHVVPDGRHEPAVLFASLELSRSTWLLTSLPPGSTKMSKHTTAGGDGRRVVPQHVV